MSARDEISPHYVGIAIGIVLMDSVYPLVLFALLGRRRRSACLMAYFHAFFALLYVGNIRICQKKGEKKFKGLFAISPSLVGLSRARLHEGQLRRGRGRHFWPIFDKKFFHKNIFTLVPLRHRRRGGQLFYRRAGNGTFF